MHTQILTIDNQDIGLDNEGFLLDPDDWNTDVAKIIADKLNINMSDHHWQIIQFIREHYDQHQSVPEARTTLKAIKNNLGSEFATRKYLYQLFPYGYGQQACKIAGMRKPLKLMLDV